jgi:hypothetical protein
MSKAGNPVGESTLAQKLAKFDVQLHAGETMATPFQGREALTPDPIQALPRPIQ